MTSALLIGIWGMIKPVGLIDVGLFLFSTIIILECLRVFVRHWPKEKKGVWVILIGIITLAIISVFQIFNVIIPMLQQSLIVTPRSFYRVYTYGGTVFIICMSIYLSYNFSNINRKLEKKLVQVKELSEKNLAKEREVRQKEIERRVLEADNLRKTKELEEARKLQLSMLPQSLKEIPELDIAFHMTPALEVGGDYYDYQFDKDGTLVLAVGDATGHGMKAGIMVAAVKSLFQSIGTKGDISSFFNSCTDTIKQMHMGNLYMALSLVRLKDKKLIISSAGMPPVLVYRRGTKKVEEIKIKGPPLGGFSGFSYKHKETSLSSGDTLLLMSDGFPELFNEKDEIIGYSLTKEIFKEAAEKGSREIVTHLISKATEWRCSREQEDDITFVVLKIV
jgi:serine phosphatase RsbU (regulator of sigma subunit)